MFIYLFIPSHLVGLVASSLAEWGSIPAYAVGIFPGRVIPVAKRLVLQWLPCPAIGVIGSVLGVAGPVLVYRDWIR